MSTIKEEQIEKNFQIDILSEIDKVKSYLENNSIVDEYVYILLWRPVEWMLDYYAYLDAKKDGITYAEFWENQRIKEVDSKLECFKDNEKYEKIYEDVNSLRDFRNRTIHRYKLVCELSVFEKFDAICKDFYNRTNKPPRNHKKTVNYNVSIEVKQYFNEEDEVASEGDIALFYNIISELKSSRRDTVILACKMESLAQRYAKNLLIDRGCSFIYHNENENGIFILHSLDAEQTSYEKILTYIDYFINNKVSKSEIRTKDALAIMRDSRNIVIHNAKFDENYIEKLVDVWFYLMEEYFSNNNQILQIISEEKRHIISIVDVIETIKIYLDLNKEYLSEGLFEEISIGLVNTQKVLTSTDIIKKQYMDKIDEAKSEEEKEVVREEYLAKCDDLYCDFKKCQSKEDIEKYNIEIQRNIGEENDDRIEGKTREYIRTALLFRDMVNRRAEHTNSIDYAGICIELTRAVELFLFDNVFVKYKIFRQNKYISDGNDSIRSLGKKYRDDNITLGDYKKIFGIEENISTDSDKQDYLEFSEVEGIYTVPANDIPTLISKEEIKIGDIKTKYRDRCAHRAGVTLEEMNACFQEILNSDDSLLKILLNDMN